MTETALIASLSESIPSWLAETVTALGYDIGTQMTVGGREDGRYYLPPDTLDSVKTRCREDQLSLVVIDGTVHPGQAVDLASALPATVWDRRELVWQRLATAGNEIAEKRLALRESRIERRRAERDQRKQATAAPSGTSGRVAELDRRCQRARESLAVSQTKQRKHITDTHGGVDADIVIVSRICGGANSLWASLTDRPADLAGPLAPPTPVTDVVTVGAHEVSVTTTPGLFRSLPEWYWETISGTQAALERADVIIAVDDSMGEAAELGKTAIETTGLWEAAVQVGEPDDRAVRETESANPVADSAGVACLLAVPTPNQPTPNQPVSDRTAPDHTAPKQTTPGWVAGVVDRSVPEAVRSRLAELLPSARLRIQLPYGDGTQSLVSRLHNRGVVETIDYGGDIALTVEVPNRAAEVQRQVEKLGGQHTELGSGSEP
jgi:50S ribosomal subunit-associated GTPase HflX